MRIDKQFCLAMEEIGEEALFDMYLEHGSVRKVVVELGWKEGTGHRLFYIWLHRDADGKRDKHGKRWARWQNVKKLRAHGAIEDMDALSNSIDEENYKQRRVQINAKDILAQRLAPSEYGTKQVNVDVKSEVTVKHQWYEAMRELAERQKLERETGTLVLEAVVEEEEEEEDD